MLKAALIGCGSMGKNHARVLSSMDGVKLDAIVDADPKNIPAGFDGRVVDNMTDLLRDKPDYAVVAAPTYVHYDICSHLAHEGVPFMVEKPVAASVSEAEKLVSEATSMSVPAAVGHIERFNSSLREAKSRIDNGLIGQILQITTRRTGPFPARISDVGVVKDLATHDIDIVRYLTGSEYKSVSSQTARRAGRPHEDLVASIGSLRDGTVVSHVVNWLSPAKHRSVTVLGEAGALEIDTLESSLTYFENGAVSNTWDTVRHFQGVAVGDVTTFAFMKQEPLACEHIEFAKFVRGEGNNIVTLEDGTENLRVAEQMVWSE